MPHAVPFQFFQALRTDFVRFCFCSNAFYLVYFPVRREFILGKNFVLKMIGLFTGMLERNNVCVCKMFGASTIRCNDMIWSTYHLRDKRAVQFYRVNESALFYGTITNPEGGKRKLGFAKKAQTMHYGRNLAFYNPSFGAWVRVRLFTVESIWSTQPNCELLWT